jgi:Kef-type K+ transport system membrane component KefB
VIAQRTSAYVPEMLSPRIIDAIELFASFFIPFYFFHAGLDLSADDFTREGLAAGLILVLVILPLRVGGMLVHRRLAQGVPMRQSLRLATALLPTLVFTLVLSHLLRDRFGVPGWLIGALVIYTLASTIIPGFVLRMPRQPDFTAPEAAAAPAVRPPMVATRAFGAGRR